LCFSGFSYSFSFLFFSPKENFQIRRTIGYPYLLLFFVQKHFWHLEASWQKLQRVFYWDVWLREALLLPRTHLVPFFLGRMCLIRVWLWAETLFRKPWAPVVPSLMRFLRLWPAPLLITNLPSLLVFCNVMWYTVEFLFKNNILKRHRKKETCWLLRKGDSEPKLYSRY